MTTRLSDKEVEELENFLTKKMSNELEVLLADVQRRHPGIPAEEVLPILADVVLRLMATFIKVFAKPDTPNDDLRVVLGAFFDYCKTGAKVFVFPPLDD